jgi:hypothetical protein
MNQMDTNLCLSVFIFAPMFLQCAQEPGPREAPVAVDALLGDLQDVGGFFHAETAEEA